MFVITTSRLVHKNAVDDMIRALAFLPRKRALHRAGHRTRRINSAQAGVETRRVGAGQVCRAGGACRHARVPQSVRHLYPRQPVRRHGNSFVEAMAAELPVIATQEGGIADFLFDPVRNRARAQASIPKGSGRAISNGVDELASEFGMPDKDLDYQTGWAVDKDSPSRLRVR